MPHQNQMTLASWWGKIREHFGRSWWIVQPKCIWERCGSQILGEEGFLRFLSFCEAIEYGKNPKQNLIEIKGMCEEK